MREQRDALAGLLELLHSKGGPEAREVRLEDLYWAEQNVLSRAFSSEVKQGETPATMGERRTAPSPPPLGSDFMRAASRFFPAEPPPPPPLAMAMLPMLDALNHQSGARTGCAFDFGKNAFVLSAQASLTSLTSLTPILPMCHTRFVPHS